ncbi:MAG: bifunctional diaminohydroxyphosphoribosylaminopyrimidine deaminase/5-amino-6-(5-phosphoribosylamino)uracil reductase RibD [Nitrospirota bacterium]
MHQVFMKRAMELAKKGLGFTSPNPSVGAVIVKGGEVVAEGYHKKAGDEHAEIKAMKELMKKTGLVTVDFDPALFENATLYVTLEPCSHNGKTPPCSKAIVAAGFKKVYVGMKDPFKKVNGRGISYLKKNGLDVQVLKVGTELGDEIRDLNQPFIKWATTGLPYLIMKAGVSLDGKIATSSGESKWITGEKARKDARRERSLCDAVMVGAGTVLADDAELAAHGVYRRKGLLRVVIDPKLRLPLDKKVFRDENVVVFCSKLASEKNVEKFRKTGVNVRRFGNGVVSVKAMLKYLAGMGVQSVFVEGGSGVHGHVYDAFLKDKSLIDKVIFYQSPKIIGGEKSLSVVGGEGISKLKSMKSLENVEYEVLDEDLKISGIFNSY